MVIATNMVKAVIAAISMFWLMLPAALKILSFKADGNNERPTQVIIVPPTIAGTNVLMIFW